MYLSPYWNYESTGDCLVVVNSVSQRQVRMPHSYLGELERVYADPQHVPDPQVRDVVAELGIGFSSRTLAERHRLSGVDVPTMPVVDQVELTNRCPYTCQMCPRTTSMTRALGNMPLSLFESIVEQISDHQSYTALHHFGESLLHPHIDEAVRIGRKHGVLTGLSCNPPTLTPSLSGRLLDARLANMVLSLDSLDADVYRSIRGHAARVDKADAHVRELVKARDAGDHETWITLQMISMDANQAEVDGFLSYCQDVGVDRGVVVRLGRWDFDDSYVDQLGEADAPGYSAPCVLPQTSVVVLWDGRVVPCCHDYEGHVVIGDLREQTMAEVWESEAARTFQARSEETALCQQCAFSPTFKDQQRDAEGFLSFHRRRETTTSTRFEWLNPRSEDRQSGSQLFDRFDVLSR